MDPDMENHLELSANPLPPEEAAKEKRLVGKWVARRKTDAKIVAVGESYDELEQALAVESIDPESVVTDVIHDPSELFLDS